MLPLKPFASTMGQCNGSARAESPQACVTHVLKKKEDSIMKQNDRSQRNALRPETFSLECVSKLRWAVAVFVRIQVFAEVTRSLTTFATVLKRPLVLAVAVAISLVSVSGVREIRAADSQDGVSAKTWEEYHPEVAEVFRKGLINWPCEKIVTELRQVEQPCITLGAGDELFVAGASGEVFHSIDLGKTWDLLCTSPDFSPEVPKGMKRVGYENVGGHTSCGIGVTDKGTLLVVWEMGYNDGLDGSYKNETVHRFAWVTRSEDRSKTWGWPLRLIPHRIRLPPIRRRYSSCTTAA